MRGVSKVKAQARADEQRRHVDVVLALMQKWHALVYEATANGEPLDMVTPLKRLIREMDLDWHGLFSIESSGIYMQQFARSLERELQTAPKQVEAPPQEVQVVEVAQPPAEAFWGRSRAVVLTGVA